ncbi:MAG: alanine racemase [Candidatus Binatia bacterium]
MTTRPAGRPTCATIEGAALRNNYALVRAALAPGSSLLAVVKADGYGHGATLVAPILEAAGAGGLGVATVAEGVELRCSGVRKPILVLTGATGGDVVALREHQLSVAVVDREMARELAAAAGGYRVRVHVKVDTGMGRLGALPADLPALVDELQRAGTFEIEGVFSHFGNADRVDQEYSDYQLRVFRGAVETLHEMGVRPRWVHLANSAATLSRPEAHFSLVRPGIVLYGVPPGATPAPAGLQPVMRLATRIVQLKTVPSEFPVSYGQTFVTRRRSVLAVLPIGYADGYDRALSNRAAVLVHGQRVAVVGAVCMDLMMVDVSDLRGVRVGDEVVLWGRQNSAEITVSEVAQWQGSVAYEVLTRLGKRVPRVLIPEQQGRGEGG